MPMQKVVSREYKVMLRPDRFADEKRLRAAASGFWRDFSRAVDNGVVRTEGDLTQRKARRLIRFFDTTDLQLNASKYVFREREDLADGEREVTLKFRHPDRHVAADRDMDAKRGANARTKFEEDVKAPFVSLYSFSTTLPVKRTRTFTRLQDIARLFPDVPGRLREFSKDETLELVNGFTARELVLGGGTVRLARKPGIDAECALIVWYPHGRTNGKPCAVEFSYRYGNKQGEYAGKSSQRAFDTFTRLQTALPAWIDPRPRTKTAFVYG